jgi:hypothetical protein
MSNSLKLLVGVLLWGIPIVRVSAQTYTCRSATSAETLAMQDYMVRLATGTDSLTVATRTQYQLPSVDASKVSVVTTANTCQTAGAAYEKALNPTGTPAVSRSMVVIKIGSTRYAIIDPAEKNGQYEVNMIMDSKFNLLAMFSS